MINHHCHYCDKELSIDSHQVSIKDGNNIILVHNECVPFMSGGVDLSEIEEKCGVEIVGRVEVSHHGDKYTYKLGTDAPHNEHGPAIEWSSGSKNWQLDGQLHRTDGPAIEWANGTRQWWFAGKRHRTDGPAIEYNTGNKQWYIEGKALTEQEFRDQIKRSK